jgi:hypothetical protein
MSRATAVGWMVLAFAFAMFLGAGIAASEKNAEYKGSHAYSDIRILSRDAHTTIRLVESPSSIDDRTLETIVDGQLVSRAHVANFDELWKGANSK